jgi:hypothetical protein
MKRESGEPTSLRGHRKDFTNHPCLFLAKSLWLFRPEFALRRAIPFRANSLPESQW